MWCSNRAAMWTCPYGLHKASMDNLIWPYDGNLPASFQLDLSVQLLKLNCILPFSHLMPCPFQLHTVLINPYLILRWFGLCPLWFLFRRSRSVLFLPLMYRQQWTLVMLNNHVSDFELGEAGVFFSYHNVEPVIYCCYTEQPHLWFWVRRSGSVLFLP